MKKMLGLEFSASRQILAGAVAGVLLAPGAALAQAAESSTSLEEIVVTAQKRSENLIQVPLAIQAVTSDALQNQGITRMEDLQTVVPGLTIQYGQGGTLSPFLRGVGNALSGNYAENSVATYVDDVPRPRMRGANALPDVERVEVLKGPQGALYGRNATGGAVNIVTRDPGDKFTGNASVSAGDFNLIEANGYVSVPLTDQLGFNVAVSRRERDGTVNNLATNTTNPLRLPGGPAGFPATGPKSDFDFEQIDSTTLTSKIKYAPNDRFTATLRGDYTRLNDTQASGWVQRDPAVLAGTLSFLTGQVFTPADFATGKPGKTGYADQAPVHDVKDYGTSLKLEGDLGAVTVTSVSAFRKTREVASIDIDGTAIPVAGFTAFFRSETFSQELRFASNTDGPFSWLAGGTYFKDKVKDETSGEIGLILVPGVGPTLTRDQVLNGQYPRISLPATRGDIDADSWAIFGQASYDLTQSLEVIASGRYTEEKRDIIFPAQINTGPTDITGGRKEHAFTPALTLNYALPTEGLVYLRWAKGYKSGGVNNLLNPTALDLLGNPVGINEFKPEKLTAYEAGYKAELLDRRLRLTAAVYHYDYKNIQFQRVLSPQATSVVLNAQKAKIDGAEFEVAARLNDVFTLSGGVNYTDAKYKRFQVADIVNFDASGNRMVSAPKLSGQVTLDADQPISDSIHLVGSGTVSYKSSLYFDPENTAANRQKAYAVVNGRVGLTMADGQYGAYVFARNLFDKTYALFGQTNSVGTVVNYGERRLIGVTLEAKFGG
ncbi:MAG: TonB-dependent receptor [Caulobacterales bacterium]